MSYQCSVRRNEAQNGIEIQFSARPPQEVIEQVKAKGFRWSRRNKVWYTKYTATKLEFASELCSENPANLASLPAEVAGKRLITSAVVTSKGKVPKNLVFSELEAGRLEAAIYRVWGEDGHNYVKRNTLQWADPFSFKEISQDMGESWLSRRIVNRDTFNSIYWVESEGWMRYRDFYLRYKEDATTPEVIEEDKEEALEAQQEPTVEENAPNAEQFIRLETELGELANKVAKVYTYQHRQDGKRTHIEFRSRWENYKTAVAEVNINYRTGDVSISINQEGILQGGHVVIAQFTNILESIWDANPATTAQYIEDQLTLLYQDFDSFRDTQVPDALHIWQKSRWGWEAYAYDDEIHYLGDDGRVVVVKYDADSERRYRITFTNAKGKEKKISLSKETSARDRLRGMVRSLGSEHVGQFPKVHWDSVILSEEERQALLNGGIEDAHTQAAVTTANGKMRLVATGKEFYGTQVFDVDSIVNIRAEWTTIPGPDGEELEVLRVADHPYVAIPGENKSSSRYMVIDVNEPDEVLTTLSAKEVKSWLWQAYKHDQEEAYNQAHPSEIKDADSLVVAPGRHSAQMKDQAEGPNPLDRFAEYREMINRLKALTFHFPEGYWQATVEIAGEGFNINYQLFGAREDVEEGTLPNNVPVVTVRLNHRPNGQTEERFAVILKDHTLLPTNDLLGYSLDQSVVEGKDVDEKLVDFLRGILYVHHPYLADEEHSDDYKTTYHEYFNTNLITGWPLASTPLASDTEPSVTYTWFNSELHEALSVVNWNNHALMLLGYRGLDNPYLIFWDTDPAKVRAKAEETALEYNRKIEHNRLSEEINERSGEKPEQAQLGMSADEVRKTFSDHATPQDPSYRIRKSHFNKRVSRWMIFGWGEFNHTDSYLEGAYPTYVSVSNQGTYLLYVMLINAFTIEMEVHENKKDGERLADTLVSEMSEDSDLLNQKAYTAAVSLVKTYSDLATGMPATGMPATGMPATGQAGLPSGDVTVFTDRPWNLNGFEKVNWEFENDLLRAEYQQINGSKTLTISQGTDLKAYYKLTDPSGIVSNGFVDLKVPGLGALETYRVLNKLAKKHAVPVAVPVVAAKAETTEHQGVTIWTNDHYYTQNPQHVHDEFYEKTGQRGLVKSVRLAEGANGSVNSLPETLSRINTANATLPSEQAVSATTTVTPVIPEPTTTVSSGGPPQSNMERAVRQHTDELSTKSTAKSKRTQRKPESEVQTPDRAADSGEYHEASYVAEHYNPGLTDDDFRIYAYYQRVLGTPVYGYYATLPVPDTEELTAWVDQQKLYPDNGILVPDYFYLSGDLYGKQQRFQRDRGTIAETWGEPVAQQQEEALSNALQAHLRKRLLLDTAVPESERLHIELLSHISETFFVSSLNSIDTFEATNEKGLTTSARKKNKLLSGGSSTTYEKLNLQDAFMLWLVKQKHNISLKYGLTVEDLINIHVYRQRRPSEEDKTVWSSLKARCKKEADRLFGIFLSEELIDEDRTRLEATWNREYFPEVEIDYRRIPIAFPIAKTYRDVPVDIRPEKRDAVTFMLSAGSGCLAYEVGYGKTWSFIFAVAQFIEMGRCTRALLVVPNQVYKQFLLELRGLAPHLFVYEYYNLDEEHLAYAQANKPTEKSVTMMTYEGFRKVGFNEQTQAELGVELDKILEQGIDERTRKQMQKDLLKVSKRQGQALRFTEIQIEDYGWDFFGVDEAHSMKKVFTAVKGEIKNGERDAQQYEVSGGMPSALATKGFMIAQYIQRKNRSGNVMLLTATPFTNSPLEVFSMLSLVGYNKLQQTGLENLKRFYDNFVEVDSRLVIDAKFQPVRKQVVTGFRNLRALQSLIYRHFDRKDIPLTSNKRPTKWVLPLRTKLVDGVFVEVPQDEAVEPILPLTAEQAEIMSAIKEYASGKIAFDDLCHGFGSMDADGDEAPEDTDPGEVLSMASLNDQEQAGVRLLRSMNLARNVALSPYLHLCTNLGPLSHRSYVETSPKLHYVMRCIASVKKHHEDTNTPVSGQVIYMDRGVDNFKLLKEYLVKVVGFEEHEVGIIRSNMSGYQPVGSNGKKAGGRPVAVNEAKDYVKNLFLGQRWDAETGEFYPIPDSERIKVVIGTSSIKEGVNLQHYGTVLYNCFVDWNPTDQIQLEGRIWRQGNQYAHVRIVNVLMEDSADIFLFQKLEEKTTRINQLWNRDGATNTFNLEEFNPEELKYSLISDPNVIAELEVREESSAIEDAKLSVQSEIKQLSKIEFYFQQLQSFPERIRNMLQDHLLVWQEPETEAGEYLFGKLKSVAKNQKLPLDGDLDTPVRSWVSIREYYTVGKGAAHPYASSRAEQEFNPYWYADFARAIRATERVVLTYLQPKGLRLEDLPKQRERFGAELEKLAKDQQELTSPTARQSRLRRIEMDRAAAAVDSKNLSARVTEFATLNHLLDERREVMQTTKDTPPKREQIEKALNGLVALEKYSTGEQQESVGKAVRGLRTLLKYTPRAA